MSAAPFVQVDRRLLRHAKALGLDDGLLRLVIALQSYDWRNGQPCKPGQRALSELAGCSERAVRRRSDRLVTLGLVTRTRHGRGGYTYALAPLHRRLDELSNRPPASGCEDASTGHPRPVEADDDRPPASAHDRPPVAAHNRPPVAGDVYAVDEDSEDVDPHTARASTILAIFNELAGTSYTAPSWHEMIAARVREHPELSDADHRAILERNFAAPWWSDTPSPSVIYRDLPALERAMNSTGRRRQRSSPAERTAQRTRERAQRGRSAPAIEGTATEITGEAS